MYCVEEGVTYGVAVYPEVLFERQKVARMFIAKLNDIYENAVFRYAQPPRDPAVYQTFMLTLSRLAEQREGGWLGFINRLIDLGGLKEDFIPFMRT